MRQNRATKAVQPDTMSKKVADQVVEMLLANNVIRIYAVAGDNLNELNDAVRLLCG